MSRRSRKANAALCALAGHEWRRVDEMPAAFYRQAHWCCRCDAVEYQYVFSDGTVFDRSVPEPVAARRIRRQARRDYSDPFLRTFHRAFVATGIAAIVIIALVEGAT